jgi:hypothetical protein
MTMSHAALMFQFPDESQACLASETLEELGYEPQRHGEGLLHIHVRNEDLTSALEIVQCYAGQLLEHSPTNSVAMTEEAYGMESIAIPAHIVNEDWEEEYAMKNRSDEEEGRGYPTDDGSYDRFAST